MIKATKQCPVCKYQGIFNLSDKNICPNDSTPLQRIYKNVSVGNIVEDQMISVDRMMLNANFKSDLKKKDPSDDA